MNIKLIFIILIILFIPDFANAGYILEHEYNETYYDSTSNVLNTSPYVDYISHSFTPATNYNFSMISLYGKIQHVEFAGDIICYLYGMNGTSGTDAYPNGTLYATSETLNASDMSTSIGWINFSFTNGYSVSNTTSYTIVGHSTDSAYIFLMGRDSVNFTDSGNSARHPFDNNWATWTTLAYSRNWIYKIYSYTSGTVSPSITSSSPSTPTDSYVNQSKEFNAGANQHGNWTWYIDSVLMTDTETNTTNAAYTNSTAPNGTVYNVTALITNANGSAQTSWNWTTLKNYITSNVTYYDRDNISINLIFNVSYVSPGTQQWGFNYSGTDAGHTYNWTYQNGTVIQSLTATTLNETLEFMKSPVLPTGIYHVVESLPAAPTIELISQTPSELYQNSTGNFSLIYGITHSTSGLNNSSIAFKNTMWDIVNDCYNNSIRPPNNNKAAYSNLFGEYILRANSRNETLNFENNATITDGNIYKWGGMDENSTELTIEVINDTYTKVHINTLIHDHVFSNMWYLDRSTMQEAPKTQYSIYKNNGALIKFWDTEAAAGHAHLGCVYLDTELGTLEPTPANPIEVWYVNKSYNPAGIVAVEDSPHAFYMTSLTKDDWVDYVYLPHANSSYARCITINSSNIENAGINVTDIAYLYLTSQTNINRPFNLSMTNVSSGTNVSFADTNVMWSGTAPFTQVNYTPNMFSSMKHDNYQYQAKLYTADNNDLWGNSTLHISDVEVSIFPPTKPNIHHILYNGVKYQNSAIDNQTFNGIVDVAVGVSTDPDGGVVTHNLTLHYRNETLVAIINNTFTEPTNTFAEIEFNTTTYYSHTDEYTMRVIATDDDGDNQTVWLGHNFTMYVTDAPTNLQNNTGNHWVHYTWDPGANTDAYNVTFNGTWYNSTDAFINHSVGAHGWGNITVWAWNDSSGISAGSIYDNVQVPNNVPSLTGCPDSNTNEDVPINDAFDLDTYFSDADGDSPSYSVYSNNQTGNVTPSIDGGNVVSYSLAANWYGVAEIVYKVEDGYDANDTDTVIVTVNSVNDPPVLQGIGPWNINEGQTVTIEVAGTDVETPDVDLDFTCNRTDLFTDFSISGGWTEWVTNYSQAGVYHVLFTVSDGTDTDNETVVITVTDIPLAIDSYWNNQTSNSLSLSVDTGTSVLFGATTNRTANSTWYLNGTSFETDTNTTQANFSTVFNVVGTHYVNVSATDGIDQTANTTFVIEVSSPAAEYTISGYVFDMNDTALSGATVSDNQSINSTTTNVSGYYLMGGYVNGSYVIEASLYGYVSNSTVATASGSGLTNQNITLVEKVSIGLSNMPYQIYIMLIIINILAIYYSFVNTDTSYYTDIITSLFACIISFVIAHNSIIGIYIIYALQTSVQYDSYSSLSLGVLFGGIGTMMLIFFIVKILELTHQELDQL